MLNENTPYAIGNWLLNGTLLITCVVTIAVVVLQISSPGLSGYAYF